MREGWNPVTNEEILAKVNERFPGAVVEAPEGMKDFTVILAPEYLVEVMMLLRDELGFDFLSGVTAVDWPQHFEMVYHLFATAQTRGVLVVKVRLADKTDPEVDSVTPLWPGASLQENEVFDLMGIRFRGHPDPRRVLLWDGFPGHPLRKEFKDRTFTFKELEPTRPKPPKW